MNTVISVRIDKQLKEAAQELAESVGLSLSTLIGAYLRQAVITGRVELYAPEEMTPKLEKLLIQAEKEIKEGKVSKVYDNVDEMIADLNK